MVPAVAAAASGRTALVIGNAAYSEDIGSLKNPGNDATDMAATLRQLGFVVTLVKDATHQRMAEAVEDFSRQLHPGSVGVFYYAGHGAQVGGRNYLIPLGARITAEAVVPYQAVAAEEVLARMDAAGQGKSLNVMILDACRNAPFMRGWRSPLRGHDVLLAPNLRNGHLACSTRKRIARCRDSTGSARCDVATGVPTRPASPGSNAWPRWGTNSAAQKLTICAMASMSCGYGGGGCSIGSSTASMVSAWRCWHTR